MRQYKPSEGSPVFRIARGAVGVGSLAGLAASAQAQEGSPPPPTPPGEWGAYLHALLRPDSVFEKLGSAIIILLVAAIAYAVAMHALKRGVRKLEELTSTGTPLIRRRAQRAVTALSLLQSLVRWVITLTVIVWLLAAAGMNIGPVLAGAGIVGVAVGFGAQALVKDIISGFFILLEAQYAVGDLVLIGGVLGVVRSVGLRTTVLESVDSRVHYIPNGSIAQVTVLERPLVRYLVDVPLSKADDLERAQEAFVGFAQELREAFPAHVSEAAVVDAHALAGGLGTVRLAATLLPNQDWLALEEIPARAKSLLQALEIAMPEGRNARAFVEAPELKPVGGDPVGENGVTVAEAPAP
jgi:moderate conductance mechanosensitive channel